MQNIPAAGYELAPRRELSASQIAQLQRDDIWYAARASKLFTMVWRSRLRTSTGRAAQYGWRHRDFGCVLLEMLSGVPILHAQRVAARQVWRATNRFRHLTETVANEKNTVRMPALFTAVDVR